MKNFIKLGCFVFLFAIMVSCGSRKPIVTKTELVTNTIVEKVHDTVFKIEKDSSSFKALLECQNGKVVVKEVIQAEPGRTLKSPRVRIDNNKLTIDCEAEAQKLLARWKSLYQTTDKISTITNTVEVERKLSHWQIVQIWCGRLLLFIILLLIATRLLWSYIKPKVK